MTTAYAEPPPGFTDHQDAETFQDSLNYFATAATLLIAYITTKGITVTPEPLPRQQRRRLEQTGQPNPWYVIRAQDTGNQTAAAGSGGGSAHGHRYDVIGHLRIGRHKLADGSYRAGHEWVRPHQRGLKHSRYIPATRRFSGDRLGTAEEQNTEPDRAQPTS